ncbi:SusD/RagB family nutrient-binding outer membrane lipoprotein [uncultured Alistipes sp.]|uniref:SusD/RagB family nutrient-binding outer membrane lipoprotein n=1 Tax=uncultured Alistipes sp. TaxID=538949 RepID=UPI0025D60059|nr:SusD/RagB family nutrient-binding outer membrane lipoprotein [uncultured Alistipes sp.]
MKKIIGFTQLLLLSVVLLCIAGCTADFADINRNPNEVTEEEMEALNYKIGTKIKSLESLVIPVEEHMYQFNESLSGGPFGGYIGATVDTWRTKFETYNPSADWRKWPFANVITEAYTPYRGIVTGTTDEVAIAFAKLLRVAIMHRVTDSYGPIPYSKIEQSESIYVEYDNQEQVYAAMFEELDEAIEAFAANVTLPADAFNRYDGVYYGNIPQWLKYANSLKLRMAMRLSYVRPELSRTKAAEAIAGGVIMSNTDNAAMHAAENRTTLIYNDWSDHRVGADIINYMNGYNDPRREKMFTSLTRGTGDDKETFYAGIRIGIDVSSKSQAVANCSNMIVATGTPYLWMNAAEVAFLRAEYELRWGTMTTAKELYEQAVALSFEERGASGAAEYVANTQLKPAPYDDPLGMYSVSFRQSEITVAWEDDSGDGADKEAIKERNLERIITQKWISIFPLGVEAWSEHRRTGYPRLLPVVEDKSGGTVDVAYGARRLPYPVEEYDKNNTNLQAAIRMLNEETQGVRRGDIMGTRVWWDCKPL